MKSIKLLALIVGAIALFPSASFAGNVNVTTQEANLDSTVIGHGNVVVTDTNQSVINIKGSGSYGGTNVGATTQKINASTVVVGSGNVEIKKAVQEALESQRSE